MNEPNWIITLAIALILSIPISLLTNLQTPKLQDWLEARSLVSKGKKLKRLEEEYHRILGFRNNPHSLYLSALSLILLVLKGFAFIALYDYSVSLSGLSSNFGLLLNILPFLIFIFMIRAIDTLRWDVNKLRRFNEYEPIVLEEIERLKAIESNNQKATGGKAALPNRQPKVQSAPPSPEGFDQEVQAILDEREQTHEKNPLRIISAKYGAQDTFVDCIAKLSALAEKGSIKILVNNTALGVDPIKGVEKDLIVEYTYAGETRSITVHEGNTLTLPPID